MADQTRQAKIRAFGDALERLGGKVAQIIAEREREEYLRIARARRRDPNRQRVVIRKSAHWLHLKLPLVDPRNWAGARGVYALGDWEVWRVTPSLGGIALDRVLVDVAEDWQSAVHIAQSVIRDEASTRDDDASDYVSWGEVPC